jgi:hypothetical protein
MSTLQIINLKHPTATSNNITFSNTGNVGIGNTLPSQQLTIQTSTQSNHLALTGSNQNAMQFLSNIGAPGFIVGRSIGVNNNNDFFIWDAAVSATRMGIDSGGVLSFNSGYGSAVPAYGVRAWVNYNAQANSIRASQGVTSITKNATGDYTVNLNFTMPDINYSYIIGISSYIGGTTLGATPMFNSTIGNAEVAPTTTTFRFATCVWNNGSGGQDAKYLNIIVVR